MMVEGRVPTAMRHSVRSRDGRWARPLALMPERDEPLAASRQVQLIWWFMALGIVARVIRYVLRFPLWEDEGFLAVNFLDRGYLELAGPLAYRQVSPLGFLWVELTVVKLLGFSELTLRLWSFACSLISLFLFRRLAGRLLRGIPLLVAVAIFAVAYPCIRYSAEAKQYGGELMVSLVLLSLAVEWWRRPDQRRWLWALAGAAPMGVALSYPAAFVGGGISLLVAAVLLCRARSERQAAGCWIAWAVYNALLVGMFLALFLLSAQNQYRYARGQMSDFWGPSFPPVTHPGALAVWLIDTHSSDLLAYPFGGHHGSSSLTLICVVAGVTVLVRRRRWLLLLLLISPLALNFVAAAVKRYPYGEMVKMQLYWAPAFCLLAGLGAAALLSAWRSGPRRSSVAIRVALAFLAAFGVASIGRDLWFPAKSASTQRYRDFSRWFWTAAEFDGEAVCLKSDWQQAFSPASYEAGLSSLYLCNQRIYSPRHARHQPPRLDLVTEDHPLRIVEYYESDRPYDTTAAAAWLKQCTARYRLVACDRYPFAFYDKRDRELKALDYVKVYKFIPK
jgi:hypothetical protein